ncbi:MAG: hypothetical protein D6813_13840, partial [Calditrichaeota bacterium]
MPRGFCGGTGKLKDIKLVLILAEPSNNTQSNEQYLKTKPNELLDEVSKFVYNAYEKSQDEFHQNARRFLNLVWPGLNFHEQMKKTWITESVLCSVPPIEGKEKGNSLADIDKEICKKCSEKYLLKQLKKMHDCCIVKVGTKAKRRINMAKNELISNGIDISTFHEIRHFKP